MYIHVTVYLLPDLQSLQGQKAVLDVNPSVSA